LARVFLKITKKLPRKIGRQIVKVNGVFILIKIETGEGKSK